MTDGAPDEPQIGPATDSVRRLLGDRLAVVELYAAALADQGVVRGLLGPREVPRLWERHILNSASVAPFLPASGTVVDLGSGAGLPGVVLASMRPDLQFVLVEPMLRRFAWLQEVVDGLGLTNVDVRRIRAEELAGELVADVVTARAVAPMDRLAGWALPLCRVGGALLALKGSRAGEELDAARPHLAALGGDQGEVLSAPTVPEVDDTSIVRVWKVAPGPGQVRPGQRTRAPQRPASGSRVRRRTPRA